MVCRVVDRSGELIRSIHYSDTVVKMSRGDPPKPRRYDNSRRAAAAGATRRRILDAAASCFGETGFAATTIRDIADRAGVSPESVYAAFGSKAAVLQAWIDVAVAGDEDEIAVWDRPEMATAREVADPLEKFRRYALGLHGINERIAAPMRVLRAAATGSPELAEILAENERRRRSDIARAIDDVVAVRPLPSHLAADRAVDLAMALSSVDVYWALVIERGWTTTEYQDQMVRLFDAVTRTED